MLSRLRRDSRAGVRSQVEGEKKKKPKQSRKISGSRKVGDNERGAWIMLMRG